MNEKLKDKFEKWYKRENKRKYHYKLNNFVDGKYDNSFIQTSYVAYIAGWLASINTPKHETVEELRVKFEDKKHFDNVGEYYPSSNSYESQVVNRLWYGYQACAKDFGIIRDHHGKPEIEG